MACPVVPVVGCRTMDDVLPNGRGFPLPLLPWHPWLFSGCQQEVDKCPLLIRTGRRLTLRACIRGAFLPHRALLFVLYALYLEDGLHSHPPHTSVCQSQRGRVRYNGSRDLRGRREGGYELGLHLRESYR